MIWETQHAVERLNDSLSARYVEPRWYVAQTCSRHEKTVAEQLGCRGIENFLPLYERVSRWKDRRVRLQLPLFAGYVFIHLPLRDRLRVLEIPGVARLVGFGGLPTAVPNEEMEALREALKGNLRMGPHPYLNAGRRVLITGGPLAGLEGILVRKKNQYRLVLSIELIQRAVFVDVDVADVAPQRGSVPLPGIARQQNSAHLLKEAR